MTNKLYFLLAVGFLTFSMTTAYAAGDPTMQRSQSRSQQSGIIDKVTNDKITVKTEDGKTRSFTINEAQREEIKNLKQGDNVDFTLDKQNQIVGFNKGGSSRDSLGSESNPGMSPNPNTSPNMDSGSGSNSNPNSNPNTTPNPNSPSNPNTNPNSTPAPAPSPMR